MVVARFWRKFFGLGLHCDSFAKLIRCLLLGLTIWTVLETCSRLFGSSPSPFNSGWSPYRIRRVKGRAMAYEWVSRGIIPLDTVADTITIPPTVPHGGARRARGPKPSRFRPAPHTGSLRPTACNYNLLSLTLIALDCWRCRWSQIVLRRTAAV